MYHGNRDCHKTLVDAHDSLDQVQLVAAHVN